MELLEQVVLLKIAAELVVADALLEPDQDIIELHVELCTLLNEGLELLSHDNCLADLREKCVLCGIVTYSA